MARSRTERTTDRGQESLFWLQFAVIAGVILVLLAVIWALLTVASIDSGAPRSAYEQQLKTLETAVQSQPDDTAAWANLVRVQATAGQFAAAKDTVTEADETLGTRKGLIETELARIALLEGRTQDALDGLEVALKLIADETQAEVDRLAELGIVQKPDPEPAITAYLLKAESLLAADDRSGAIEAYSQALEFDPTMADVLVERGLLYVEMSNTESAKSDFESALTFIPDYAPALEALARIER